MLIVHAPSLPPSPLLLCVDHSLSSLFDDLNGDPDLLPQTHEDKNEYEEDY